MVSFGVTMLVTDRVQPGSLRLSMSGASLWLCVLGLIGVFAVGYLGHFIFDAIWPGFYYAPVADGKNAWLIGQGLCSKERRQLSVSEPPEAVEIDYLYSQR
ncbi:hypothetical protein [Rhizobium sp. YS-1r]|uniref:hypothetical protein n=1 Tax=Rhizobium sp. YS-1r TaxID=1532558 RepID=UPI00126A2CF8|nr:hypothetical protein [Rhizobium sp. YS-1r]